MLNKRFGILIYHQVFDEIDPLRPYEVDKRTFERQIRTLTRYSNVLPLSEAIVRANEGALPRSTICITFDDGYADNRRNALPVLQKFGATASFFVSTGFTDGSIMFNDLVIEAVRGCQDGEIIADEFHGPVEVGSTVESRFSAIRRILRSIKYLPQHERQEYAENLADKYSADLTKCTMMTRDEIRTLASAGMEIGAHTVTHPILLKLSDTKAKSEILKSKMDLEDILQNDVTTFAYPNGRRERDYGEREISLVQECGFRLALSTEWAAASRDSPRFELPRVSIGTNAGLRLFLKGFLQRF